MPEASPEDLPTDERSLSLSEMASIIWRRKLVVICAVLVSLALAVTYVKLQTPLYTATMLVMPPTVDQAVAPQQSGGLGAQVLGSLTGGGAVADTTFLRYLETYNTVSFAARLQHRYQLLQRLTPGRWDPRGHRWKPPTGPIASFRSVLANFIGIPSYSDPSAGSLAAYLAAKVDDTALPRSNIHRISYANPDPKFAVDLLATMHREADALLRDEAAEATRVKLNRLQARIDATSQAQHRDILFGILAEQQRRLMMLDPHLPFAAVVIDSPTASDLPTSPRPLLTLIEAILLGLLVGISLTFVLERRRPLRP